MDRYFFIDGPGGTGKTFLLNTIIHKIIANNFKCLVCASTGIAATLLFQGTTIHSRFKIPIPTQHDSISSYSVSSEEALHIKNTSVIIIDEAE